MIGPIAAAAVSNEDASQMQRMQDRGQSVVVSLFMDSVLYPDSPSRNLLIDLVGSELPDEYGAFDDNSARVFSIYGASTLH
jgi:hypothetical protein